MSLANDIHLGPFGHGQGFQSAALAANLTDAGRQVGPNQMITVGPDQVITLKRAGDGNRTRVLSLGMGCRVDRWSRKAQ